MRRAVQQSLTLAGPLSTVRSPPVLTHRDPGPVSTSDTGSTTWYSSTPAGQPDHSEHGPQTGARRGGRSFGGPVPGVVGPAFSFLNESFGLQTVGRHSTNADPQCATGLEPGNQLHAHGLGQRLDAVLAVLGNLPLVGRLSGGKTLFTHQQCVANAARARPGCTGEIGRLGWCGRRRRLGHVLRLVGRHGLIGRLLRGRIGEFGLRQVLLGHLQLFGLLLFRLGRLRRRRRIAHFKVWRRAHHSDFHGLEFRSGRQIKLAANENDCMQNNGCGQCYHQAGREFRFWFDHSSVDGN